MEPQAGAPGFANHARIVYKGRVGLYFSMQNGIA